MDLVELLEEFLIDCRIRNLSKRTIDTYSRNISIVIKLLDESGVEKLSRVTRASVNRVIMNLQEKGLKFSYINIILKCLRVYFNYAETENYISKNPMDKVSYLKVEKQVMYTFTDEEVMKMIDYYRGKGFLTTRNRLIIEMFADTGLRVSELRNLKNEGIKDGFLIVMGKGNKERVVPLSPYLMKSISKYKRIKYDYFRNLRIQREISDYLLLTKSGKMMTSNVMLELIVRESAEAINVRDEVHRKSCHSLRHFYAQKLLKTGTNIYTISRLLGHSSLRTTQMYLNSLSDDEIINEVSSNTPLMTMLKNR